MRILLDGQDSGNDFPLTMYPSRCSRHQCQFEGKQFIKQRLLVRILLDGQDSGNDFPLTMYPSRCSRHRCHFSGKQFITQRLLVRILLDGQAPKNDFPLAMYPSRCSCHQCHFEGKQFIKQRLLERFLHNGQATGNEKRSSIPSEGAVRQLTTKMKKRSSHQNYCLFSTLYNCFLGSFKLPGGFPGYCSTPSSRGSDDGLQL